MCVEEGLWNVWFNMANAHLKLGQKAEVGREGGGEGMCHFG